MAVLTDKQMDKHIKEKNFAKIYLIYGDEQMYVRKYTDKLVTAVAGKTPSDFNFHSFGDSINFDELAASVQIVPFMSEYNCVLVSDAAFDEFNANDNARFADIYKAVPDGTVFIVSLPSIKPKKNTTVLPALKKYADKNGIVCEFNTLTQNELVKFIAKWANANGKIISQVNAAHLISLCGRDLNMLKMRLIKFRHTQREKKYLVMILISWRQLRLRQRFLHSRTQCLMAMHKKRLIRLMYCFISRKKQPICCIF